MFFSKPEPIAGDLRWIIEPILYDLLDKGRFYCVSSDDPGANSNIAPMTTRDEVEKYFNKSELEIEMKHMR